jgi:hypothetical protein
MKETKRKELLKLLDEVMHKDWIEVDFMLSLPEALDLFGIKHNLPVEDKPLNQ